MIINIYRGQSQIGGSIIEISTEETRVVFDVGINLDEPEEIEIPQIEGLFLGEPLYDAVIVSHYHSDHMGLIEHVLKKIPIYMGRQAFEIIEAVNIYKGKTVGFDYCEYYDGCAFDVGDLIITPYKCDHSAYDAYMFTVSDGKTMILYTGDFRANGRSDYNALLDRLPKVDGLIIEGTMLSRETFQKNIDEEALENIAVTAMNRYKGAAFLMTSAMNIDRIVTGYNAARKANRIFLEDLYTAGIMKAIGENVPSPGTAGIRVFMTGGDRQYELLQQYGECKIGKQRIADTNFLMCIRPSMVNYLKRLNEICTFEGGVLFYSMWRGYQQRDDMKSFLDFMESRGIKIYVLHTSGHADVETIDRLINVVQPHCIIPVHTENPYWYMKYDIPVVIDESRIVV